LLRIAHPPSPRSSPPVVLTIAGHDPSSGAGITADLLTFAAHGLFGTSVPTALTVQSTLGVAASVPADPELLLQSLSHLCADLPPAGIKIGMLGSAAVASAVAEYLRELRDSSTGPSPVVVFDPVLRASSGAELLSAAGLDSNEALKDEALKIVTRDLLPVVDWVTPNWVELAVISAAAIGTEPQAEAAMHLLGRRHHHLHIVATGGDQASPTDLLRLPSGELHRFAGEPIATTSTHGTGCAFSSALLSRLVLGDSAVEAVQAAKDFVAGALRHAPGLGRGRGPLDLLWRLRRA
jgi:hydroxymethylpyrimidine/phosphomethylpyrimidine kinase